MYELAAGDLNEEQKEAIYESQSVFLTACPGSGKTRTLTFKAALELSNLESHRRYVGAITYTHRAADEIEERTLELGIDTTQLWVGTIHSFCLEWILKPYGIYHDALVNGFSIINGHEREVILDRICRQYTGHRVTHWDCDYYYENGALKLKSPVASKHAVIRAVLQTYFEELRRERKVDFDQMLEYASQILERQPVVARVLSSLFAWLLVDEYQDTQKVQYSIISAILNAGSGASRVFIVGDPNQAIYGSLGGYAIDPDEFRDMIGIPIRQMSLRRNYRSTSRLIHYFSNYADKPAVLVASADHQNDLSLISYDNAIHRNDLEGELVRLIRHSIETIGISPHEICVVAPWWVQLAAMTRRLTVALPEYNFNGPGTTPFSRDIDNFWYKVARVGLTESSPGMYVRRLRWAREILTDLEAAGVDIAGHTSRTLLKLSNSIKCEASDGLTFLHDYFDELFARMGLSWDVASTLVDQRTAFVDSSEARIEKLRRDGAAALSDVESFRQVFKPKSGITISTIHGVKGAEFDTVIGFAILEGMVPHFSEQDPETSSNKLMYVVGSHARRNLHLLSERGRVDGRGSEYRSTKVLRQCQFEYDEVQ